MVCSQLKRSHFTELDLAFTAFIRVESKCFTSGWKERQMVLLAFVSYLTTQKAAVFLFFSFFFLIVNLHHQENKLPSFTFALRFAAFSSTELPFHDYLLYGHILEYLRTKCDRWWQEHLRFLLDLYWILLVYFCDVYYRVMRGCHCIP